MDFFDVRKLSANLARESQSVGNESRYREEDYSLIALFPIAMIAAVMIVICGAYKLKRWKLEKRQMEQLSVFYDLVEEAQCDHFGHSGTRPGCDRLRAALLVPPPRTSSLFQPPSTKSKKTRIEVPVSSASSVDLSYQISKLMFHDHSSHAV